MWKKSFISALIFGVGALTGKGLYMLVNPHPEYSAPIWLQLAVPAVGAFIGAFLVTLLIELIRKKLKQ